MSNITNQESGRSMVEMLGVLAVIGVLSIAGIAGYTTAINKHRANEILNAASVRAMVVSAQIQQDSGRTPSLDEFSTSDNLVAGVTFSNSVNFIPIANFFTLTLSGLTEENDICAQMKSIAGSKGIVKISKDCTSLSYNKDMSPGVVIVDFDGENCSDHLSYNTDEETCEKCGGTWSGSACTGKKCSNGYYRTGTNGDSCVPCTGISVFTSTEEYCSACENTSVPRIIYNERYCVPKNCPDDTFRNNQGKCESCTFSQPVTTSEEECALCGLVRKYASGKCKPSFCEEGNFMLDIDICFPCNQKNSMVASEAECNKCNTTENPRKVYNYNSKTYCALDIACGSGEFRGSTGQCYACSYSSGQPASETECALCDTTATPREINDKGFCVLKS